MTWDLSCFIHRATFSAVAARTNLFSVCPAQRRDLLGIWTSRFSATRSLSWPPRIEQLSMYYRSIGIMAYIRGLNQRVPRRYANIRCPSRRFVKNGDLAVGTTDFDSSDFSRSRLADVVFGNVCWCE
jgi:hypothetical protein